MSSRAPSRDRVPRLARWLSPGFVLLASPAHAVDSGRLDLLAREAADVLAPTAAPSAAFVAEVVVGALLASLLGTWLGLRTRTFRAAFRSTGPRELTLSFPTPVRVDAEMLARMTGGLQGDEAVDPAVVAPAPPPAAAAASQPAGARVEFPRDPAIPANIRWSPPAARRLARAAATARADATRVASYASARRLLREGLDRETVRRRTGLKLAELDLLRCAPPEDA